MDEQSGGIKYCCRGLEHVLHNVSERGWSFYTQESLGSPFFYMGFRAIASADAKQFNALLKRLYSKGDPYMQFTVAGRTPIKFCPWCGRRLSRAYKKTWKELLAPDDMGFSGET